MTETHCIQFHNMKKNGEKMRPGTPSPGMHWTSMFYEGYKQYFPDIRIVWNPEPQLHITKKFVDRNEEAFKHLMSFIKMHNLNYVIDASECAKCEGHASCLAVQDGIKHVS